MTIWFVSRHPGALDWAARHGIGYERHVAHLDPEEVSPGDTVIGSLLVRGWGLPQFIRFHHERDVYDLPDKTLPGGAVALIAVTQIAEHLANEMDGEVDLEVGTALYERALAHFGIQEEDIEDLREAIETARAAS